MKDIREAAKTLLHFLDEGGRELTDAQDIQKIRSVYDRVPPWAKKDKIDKVDVGISFLNILNRFWKVEKE